MIVNADFDQAYADIETIYRGERLRRRRNPWLAGFVESLDGEG